MNITLNEHQVECKNKEGYQVFSEIALVIPVSNEKKRCSKRDIFLFGTVGRIWINPHV